MKNKVSESKSPKVQASPLKPLNPSTLEPLKEGWRWVRLGEVCEINPTRPKNLARSPNAPTTFVPMAAVDEKMGVIAKPEVVPYSKVTKGYTYFEENDVLFAKITPCMQNGKHVIARNLIDGIGFGTTEFHVLKPKKEIISEWIHFFIRQPYFLKEATLYFTGAVGQQRVPESFLSDYLIPFPPLSTQKRISEKLQELIQEVEQARATCEKQLQAAKALPAAYLREVFENEEAKRWDKKKLGEVCEELYRYPTYYNINYVDKGVPEIRGELIKSDGNLEVDLTKYRFISKETSQKYPRTILKEGDLVLSVRGSMGKVALVHKELEGANITANLIRISPDPSLVYPLFLMMVFLSEYFQRTLENFSPQTTIKTIKAPVLKSISIPLPLLSEQNLIADELKEKMGQAENLQYTIRNQQSAIKVLPQAILRKAFRGEL